MNCGRRAHAKKALWSADESPRRDQVKPLQPSRPRREVACCVAFMATSSCLCVCVWMDVMAPDAMGRTHTNWPSLPLSGWLAGERTPTGPPVAPPRREIQNERHHYRRHHQWHRHEFGQEAALDEFGERARFVGARLSHRLLSTQAAHRWAAHH